MNNKLLLATGITLLYRESQLSNRTENSAAVVKEIANMVKVPDQALGIGSERDILVGLKDTMLWMCENPPAHDYEFAELSMRLKMNCMDEEGLYDTIAEGIAEELSETKLKKACLSWRRTLKKFLEDTKVKEVINKANYALKFKPEGIKDMRTFVADVMNQLEIFQVEKDQRDPAVITDLDISNQAASTALFNEVKNQDEGQGIFRTGWQGLNRMLDGGFRAGEQWVIGALQHQWKTGSSLSLFKHFALYNVPVLRDPTKKALLLRISFEDTAQLNMQFLYQSLMENEGKPTDLTAISAEDMAAYVHAKLGATGFEIRLMHVDPSMWTYRDVCNKVIELEAEGYEVQVCMLDYMLKLPTTGCDQGPMGHDIRNMYERFKNFMMARKILFITPHQLSTDAKKMIREGRQDFVKELPGKGYYSGTGQLDQVVDGELFLHIEEVNGVAWLTIQRGKHRKARITPKEYHYMALPFLKQGGILDDIYGQDTTRKRVGGGPIGSSDEIPFWSALEKQAA